MLFRTSSSAKTASTILICTFALICTIMCTTSAAQTQAQHTSQPPQQPSTPPQSPPPYTLHVYANLMEIPTLVLSQHFEPLPPIPPSQFEISLDAGPVFHPTQLQLEGSQPIDLAILLDLNGNGRRLVPSFAQSLPDLLSHALLPHDRVSLFAVQGSCINSAQNLPPTASDRITSALDQLLHARPPRSATQSQPQCKKSDELWNAIASVAQSMTTSPGHRVILVLSDGQDRDSTIHWQALREYCASSSIAIFGLAPAQRKMPDPGIWMKLQYDPFSSLTQLSGGLVLYTTPARMQQQLNHFIELVRGRYILEFPSPDTGAPGVHSIDVKVGDTDDFVRPSGIAFVPPDPSLRSSPTTVASPPSPATFGDHSADPPPQ